jgi:hypothetical protein
VFTAAERLLRPGGGIAIITHGRPLWLGERDWTQALRGYLESWLGPVSGTCGTDDPTRAERRRLLERTGFVDVTVLEDEVIEPVDVDFVLGHLYSAMSAGQIAPERRSDFEAGLRAALRPYAHAPCRDGPLLEDVPIDVLVGRRADPPR